MFICHEGVEAHKVCKIASLQMILKKGPPRPLSPNCALNRMIAWDEVKNTLFCGGQSRGGLCKLSTKMFCGSENGARFCAFSSKTGWHRGQKELFFWNPYNPVLLRMLPKAHDAALWKSKRTRCNNHALLRTMFVFSQVSLGLPILFFSSPRWCKGAFTLLFHYPLVYVDIMHFCTRWPNSWKSLILTA